MPLARKSLEKTLDHVLNFQVRHVQGKAITVRNGKEVGRTAASAKSNERSEAAQRKRMPRKAGSGATVNARAQHVQSQGKPFRPQGGTRMA